MAAHKTRRVKARMGAMRKKSRALPAWTRALTDSKVRYNSKRRYVCSAACDLSSHPALSVPAAMFSEISTSQPVARVGSSGRRPFGPVWRAIPASARRPRSMCRSTPACCGPSWGVAREGLGRGSPSAHVGGWGAPCRVSSGRGWRGLGPWHLRGHGPTSRCAGHITGKRRADD